MIKLKGKQMENLNRNSRQELEDYLNKTEEMSNKIKEEITRVRVELKKLDEKEAELVKEYVIEIPEDYVYILLEHNDLQIHYMEEDITIDSAECLNELGLIRNTAESAWVSARRNIRANRLEALAHSIGGAYEFELGVPNYYVVVDYDGKFKVNHMHDYLEPEKIYMTKDTAEQVCEILNSGRYKLNVDVAVEESCCEEGEEEFAGCPCYPYCACQDDAY